jgi:hypothetical protein
MDIAIPARLSEEFATVDAVWRSTAATRGLDALILSWVKYEKQLRRLFCFLVFQNPDLGEGKNAEVVSVLLENDNLYPRHFIKAIGALEVKPVPALVGPKHDALAKEIARINHYRNRLMHGQLSGDSMSREDLGKDVAFLIEWIDALASGADREFGFDGLVRNACHAAAAQNVAVAKFPFKTMPEFKDWLRQITHPKKANAPTPPPRV